MERARTESCLTGQPFLCGPDGRSRAGTAGPARRSSRTLRGRCRTGAHSGHGERHGDADAERAQNALRHDKDGLAEAGEIAHKAEQERGQQTGDGVGFEISDIVR